MKLITKICCTLTILALVGCSVGVGAGVGTHKGGFSVGVGAGTAVVR